MSAEGNFTDFCFKVDSIKTDDYWREIEFKNIQISDISEQLEKAKATNDVLNNLVADWQDKYEKQVAKTQDIIKAKAIVVFENRELKKKYERAKMLLKDIGLNIDNLNI